MKSYFDNGEQFDDGRVPRSRTEIDGWYRGDTIHSRDPSKHPTWIVIGVVAVLCVIVILLCGVRR